MTNSKKSEWLSHRTRWKGLAQVSVVRISSHQILWTRQIDLQPRVNQVLAPTQQLERCPLSNTKDCIISLTWATTTIIIITCTTWWLCHNWEPLLVFTSCLMVVLPPSKMKRTDSLSWERSSKTRWRVVCMTQALSKTTAITSTASIAPKRDKQAFAAAPGEFTHQGLASRTTTPTSLLRRWEPSRQTTSPPSRSQGTWWTTTITMNTPTPTRSKAATTTATKYSIPPLGWCRRSCRTGLQAWARTWPW